MHVYGLWVGRTTKVEKLWRVGINVMFLCRPGIRQVVKHHDSYCSFNFTSHQTTQTAVMYQHYCFHNFHHVEVIFGTLLNVDTGAVITCTEYCYYMNMCTYTAVSYNVVF